MKRLKKVIAVLAALLIVGRIVLMGVSAAMVGTATMVGIVAILAAALVSSGQFTQSQVNSMSNNDIISSYRSSVESGTINPKERIKLPDGVTYEDSEFASVVDYFFAYDKFVFDSWKYHVTEGWEIIDNAIDDWLTKWYQAWNNEYTDVDDIVKPMLKGDINMNGYGALVVLETERVIYNYYSDYVVIDRSKINSSGQFSYTRYYNLAEYHDWSKWDASLSSWNYGSYSSSSEWGDSRYKFYGDIRYEDGTKAETDDEYEYPLGETEDGTKVTVDMLNPDATVTVDGVTEKPSDYINIEYYTDPAVIDLLQQILNALDKANVVVPDETKDIVDEISGDIELEISSSLMDYTVPKAIATVFPFCLPFDFVRGMKLMFEKPKVPVFKTELDLTNICGFNLGKHQIEISLEKWESAAVICRWFSLLMFSYTLILLTPKITKGAGA